MKIALDATPLLEKVGGIRRYTVELARALASEFPEDNVLLVSDQSYQEGVAGVAEHRVPSRRYWSAGLPGFLGRERVDIFHGTDFAVPYWPARPAVLTLHDLSPWKWGASDRVRRRTAWLLRFGLASMVITPTDAVRREALDHFGLNPEEVAVVPEAAAEFFQPVATPPAKPFFLALGQANQRKNLQTVEKAAELIGQDLRVVEGVSEEDLRRLYVQATAFVYPSLYEGFGLPVVEAMQCGAAVLTSDAAALREVGGEGCIALPAHDVSAWAGAMLSLLVNPERRGELRERGLKRARQFSWRRTAALTREVYLTAIRRHRG